MKQYQYFSILSLLFMIAALCATSVAAKCIFSFGFGFCLVLELISQANNK